MNILINDNKEVQEKLAYIENERGKLQVNHDMLQTIEQLQLTISYTKEELKKQQQINHNILATIKQL